MNKWQMIEDLNNSSQNIELKTVNREKIWKTQNIIKNIKRLNKTRVQSTRIGKINVIDGIIY